jgi:hypothetical protein
VKSLEIREGVGRERPDSRTRRNREVSGAYIACLCAL